MTELANKWILESTAHLSNHIMVFLYMASFSLYYRNMTPERVHIIENYDA